MHNSNLNYKHMLQCTKVVWKITCVLGWIFRSHARDGSEIQTSGRRGSAGKIEKLGFLIHVNPKHAWKSWNLPWCHDRAPTCCGNFFGGIGTSFGISYLQTGASLKKLRGSDRETCPPCGRNDNHCLFSPCIFFYRQHGTTGYLYWSLNLFRVHLAFLYTNWVS